MTYVASIDRYGNGRPETLVDCRALAADLARELGGRVDPDRFDNPHDNRALILLDSEMELLVATSHNAPTRATISASPATEWTRFLGHTGRNYRLAECSVSGDRDLQAIVRDVQRKVIAEGAEGLAGWREDFQRWTDLTARATQLCADLKARHPDVDFWLGDRRDQRYTPTSCVRFSARNFNGSLHVDGGVTFERVNLSEVQGLALLAQLALTPGV